MGVKVQAYLLIISKVLPHLHHQAHIHPAYFLRHRNGEFLKVPTEGALVRIIIKARYLVEYLLLVEQHRV